MQLQKNRPRLKQLLDQLHTKSPYEFLMSFVELYLHMMNHSFLSLDNNGDLL